MSNLIDQADEAHARDRERIAALEADNARYKHWLDRIYAAWQYGIDLDATIRTVASEEMQTITAKAPSRKPHDQIQGPHR
jgi:hypothetical protein